MSYRVDATFTVEMANPAAASGLGAAGDEQKARVRAAADVGLKELESIARRYGFAISNATATVEESS